jgi:hypothetical protein
MKIWNKGDTCYFSGIRGFGKSTIKGTIEEIDGCDVLVNVPNGHKSPWMKKLSDLFETEKEAEEMVSLENSEMPSILDIVSVQPMFASTSGSIAMRYIYGTNSTQPNVNQPSTVGGNDKEDIGSARKPKEKGDTGGIQGRYKIPPFHI